MNVSLSKKIIYDDFIGFPILHQTLLLIFSRHRFLVRAALVNSYTFNHILFSIQLPPTLTDSVIRETHLKLKVKRFAVMSGMAFMPVISLP